ncbi:MAG: DUF4908 domain-containing protein [Alphaproteobacteria bacterium]|nr:DUF4908 domain-containing protein [Alphaproteobacteria bacterium]
MKAVLVLVLVALLPAAAGAQSADSILARLSAEKPAAPEPGLYSAGEGRDFVLLPWHGKYLLRFAGAAETFVLTSDPGSLGAKLLKYDTGAAALSVSVWGGVTLYAADAPGGLPATRQGDAATPAPAAITAADLKSAFDDEGNHFSYADNLGLRFMVDGALPADAGGRALLFDVLDTCQAGIERFLAAGAAARQALSHHVAQVKLEKAAKPGLALNGRTLLVRYVPADGFLGRLSSHAVAHQLGKLLAVKTAE